MKRPTLDRHADTPLYGQIARDLEHQLTETYGPGDPLPPVSELARRYAVNRLTVTEALAVLVRRGLVTTVKGRGSFAALPIIRWDVRPGDDASLTRAMLARGHSVDNRLLDVVDDHDEELRSELGAAGVLRRFEIVRFVDGEPWSVTSTWIDPSQFAGLEARWRASSSFHSVLLEGYGVRMTRSARTFAALAADATEADLLQVPVASPLLGVTGLNVDERDRPVAAVEHRFRGDRVQFTMVPA